MNLGIFLTFNIQRSTFNIQLTRQSLKVESSMLNVERSGLPHPGSWSLARAPLLGLCLLLSPFRSPALDWQTNGPHRYAAVTVPGGGKPGFTLLSPAVTGINFTNVLPQSRHLTNQILLNGSGVAAGDIDGD